MENKNEKMEKELEVFSKKVDAAEKFPQKEAAMMINDGRKEYFLAMSK